jgi:hypothetical protein
VLSVHSPGWYHRPYQNPHWKKPGVVDPWLAFIQNLVLGPV